MQRVLSFPVTRGFGEAGEFVTKRMCFSFMFSIGFLALLSGFLLGRFAFDQELAIARKQMRQSAQKAVQNAVPQFSEFEDSAFKNPFSEDVLLANMKYLSDASQKSFNATLGQANMLRDYLLDAGFDLVSPLRPVMTPLAYPDPNQSNQVLLLNGIGSHMAILNDSRPPYLVAPDAVPASVSLSSATIKGKPVYVNFGRDEDYLYLDSMDITVAGHVVLARVGGLSVTDLVVTALDHDATAVLLYLDPAQTDVSPELLSAKELAALQQERGASSGGPETVNSTTPVLVISTWDAELFLKHMEGTVASPGSWRGGLNCSYPLGPGFADPDWSVEVRIHTANVVDVSYDVVAALRGSHEPDRLVMIGSSPLNSAGSAALMELAEQLGSLSTAKGWRPHRSLGVAFWCRSDGDTWRSLLGSEVVAYLDLDLSAMGANYTIRGSHMMLPVFNDATSFLLSRSHVDELDTLLELGHSAAVDRAGVPFLQLQTDGSFDGSTMSYIEIGELGALWGRIALQLASEPSLPYSLDPYVAFLNHSMVVLNQRFDVIARRHKLFLETLTETVQELIAAIHKFQTHWSQTGIANVLALRRMNDQLVAFSQALACPRASDTLPRSERLLLTRHILFARSRTGIDVTSGLGELQDLLRAMTSTQAPQDLQRQIVTLLTDTMRCLKNATYALTDRLDTLILGKT